MPLAPIQPALKCGSSWMSIQSSMNPQSAKSSKSQPLWALENKWFNMWHAAEEFTLLTDLRKHHKRRLGSFAGASKVLYPILLGYTKVPYTKLLLVAYSASAMSYLQCELVLNDAFCIQSKQMNMSSHKAETMARIAWPNESISWKAFPVQLRWSTRCLGFSHGKGAKTANTAERTQHLQWPSTPQTKARLPAHAWESYTTCFLFESRHPTVSVLISKRYVWSQSVASKNLTTNGFIRMTYWYSNHPNRSICRTSGALCRTC